MISTRKRCDNLSMIFIARRMLSDLHVVLSGTFSGFYTYADRRDCIIYFISIDIHVHTCMPQHNCAMTTFFVVRVMPVEMYGKSWYVDCKCYMWLDSEEREECNDTKIIFIALSMRKLLMRSVRPTQREQTIVYIVSRHAFCCPCRDRAPAAYQRVPLACLHELGDLSRKLSDL